MPEKKFRVKPSKGLKSAVLAQTVLSVLLLPAGAFLYLVSEGEARPFALFFALVWTAACGFLIYRGRKALKAIKEGTFSLEFSLGEEESPSSRLRELDALRKDRLLSDEEYEKKRAEIMEEKW